MADRVIITIKRKPRPSRRGQAPRSRDVGSRQRTIGPGRRRLRASGGIRIFDLGYQKTGGVFISNTASVIPPFILAPGGTWVSCRDLQASDYDSLRTSILAEDVTQFETKFKEVTRAENSAAYGILVDLGDGASHLDDLTEWTSNGLEANQAALDAGVTIYGSDVPGTFIQGDFTTLILKDGSSHQKITSTPAYGDAGVPFTPSGDMKVFLMPGFGLSTGSSSYLDAGTDIRRATLNQFYVVMPREWFLVPSNTHYQKYSGDIIYPDSYPIANYEAVIDVVLTHQSLAGSRYIDRRFDGADPLSQFYYVPAASIPGGGYPHQDRLYAAILDPGYDPALKNGILKAVVKKQDSYYYFWSTDF